MIEMGGLILKVKSGPLQYFPLCMSLLVLSGFMGLSFGQFIPTPNTAPVIISGRVLGANDSQPIDGAFVIIEPQGKDASGAKTGPDGRFHVETISVPRYRVIVQKSGYLALTRFIEEADLHARETIRQNALRSVDVDLRILAQAAVTGRVTGPLGEPLINATVQICQMSLSEGRSTVSTVTQASTNDLGEYRIFGLEPGRYYVGAVYQDNASLLGLRQARRPVISGSISEEGTEDYAVTYYPGTLDIAAATPVRLKSGQSVSSVDIRVVMARTFSIEGVVANLPPNQEGVSVFLEPSRPGSLGVRRMYSLQAGNTHFIFKSIPFGEYAIRAGFRAGDLILSAREEVVVGQTRATKVTLQFRPSFSIVGKVSYDRESSLPDGLTLTLRAADRRLQVPIKAEADGSFRVPVVGADSYSIHASSKSNRTFVKSVTLNDRPVGVAGINIADPNHILRIELSDNGGSIAGVASGKGQLATAKGLVVLVSLDIQEARSYAVPLMAGGKFTFQPLPAGKYRISCFTDLATPGEATWDILRIVRAQGKDVTLAEGENQQLTLEAAELDPFLQ